VQTRERAYIEKINEAISLFVAKRDGIKVSDIADVIDKLEAVKGYVLDLAPIKSSAQKRADSLSAISKLILELRAQIPL
jgi:hypothetical protein